MTEAAYHRSIKLDSASRITPGSVLPKAMTGRCTGQPGNDGCPACCARSRRRHIERRGSNPAIGGDHRKGGPRLKLMEQAGGNEQL
jgi:hypothetical protein